jgi:hypothetical protein
MDLQPTMPADGVESRLAALLGVASVALLAAALRWAHHWGPVADSIVAAWAAATLGGLFFSLSALKLGLSGRRAALTGLALVGVSFVALIGAGIAMAAGTDPAGACGGG